MTNKKENNMVDIQSFQTHPLEVEEVGELHVTLAMLTVLLAIVSVTGLTWIRFESGSSVAYSSVAAKNHEITISVTN